MKDSQNKHQYKWKQLQPHSANCKMMVLLSSKSTRVKHTDLQVWDINCSTYCQAAVVQRSCVADCWQVEQLSLLAAAAAAEGISQSAADSQWSRQTGSRQQRTTQLTWPQSADSSGYAVDLRPSALLTHHQANMYLQVSITLDQVQSMYWSMDTGPLTTGTQIRRLIESYSMETAKVLKAMRYGIVEFNIPLATV